MSDLYKITQNNAPGWMKESYLLKLACADNAINNIQINGYQPEDTEAVLLQNGFSGFDEYWSVALSEPMTVALFTQRISVHLFDKKISPKPLLIQGLQTARIMNEKWFIEDLAHPPAGREDLSHLKVMPPDAARWFLSMPKQKNLLPESLVRFLNPSPQEGRADPNLTHAETPKRSRGVKPLLVEATKAKMLKLKPADLAAMKEEEMEATFKASRYTCRKARNAILPGRKLSEK